MSSVTSGAFPFQVSSQDTFSNYENPAFKVRIRDIRDTGLPSTDDFNDVDYSDVFRIGEIVVGQRAAEGKRPQKMHKGTIESIVCDDRGNQSIVIIRTHGNKRVKLDPQTVVRVKNGSQPTELELLGHHDNFFVPGPSKDMSEPRALMAESRIKSFTEFINGL